MSPTTRAASLRTSRLAVRYGRFDAVRDVSLVVEPGESVAVVGRNGAGKSSLLKSLAGLVPCSGIREVDGSPRPAAGTVAYVPQRSTARWDLPLTVTQVVEAGCRRPSGPWRRPSSATRLAARGALGLLDIGDLAHRVVGTLSGGQAQRVLLARAFAQDPRILLLDEPFAGLDAASADYLADAIGTMQRQGLTIVCVLHELGMARRLFPRTVALATTVVADGPTPTVLDAEGIERIFVGASHPDRPEAAA